MVKHLMVVVDRKQGDKEKLGYRIYSLADRPNRECLLRSEYASRKQERTAASYIRKL